MGFLYSSNTEQHNLYVLLQFGRGMKRGAPFISELEHK